jgi:hypothetical protein
MAMIDLPAAQARLAHIVPALIAAHEAAWSRWRTLVDEEPALALPLGATARANFIHDHVCAEIIRRVDGIPGVEPTDRLEFFALRVGSDILLRFKFVGHGAPSNVATNQQKLLARQAWDERMVLRLNGDLLARAVIAIADKHMRLCARCKQPDDGRMSCRVDCNDCQGGGATECSRCNGAGSYLTSHMILLDDPCEGMVEI